MKMYKNLTILMLAALLLAFMAGFWHVVLVSTDQNGAAGNGDLC